MPKPTYQHPVPPRSVTVKFYEEPADVDWNLVCEWLKTVKVNQPLMDLKLTLEIVPEQARGDVQFEEELRERPIFVATDGTGFNVWVFFDGSDSEG